MKTFTQGVAAKLTAAWTVFEKDPQLKSGIASLYVLDAITGSVMFERNAYTGLAPASTQKIITAAAAYELLGKDFRYQTAFAYSGALKSGRLAGNLVILPSGDPTLGSWRWKQTAEDSVVARVVRAMAKNGIASFNAFAVNATGWESESVPGGWTWGDIGNYYGAGAEALSWRENQYDLLLKSGELVGSQVTVVGTKPILHNYTIRSEATAGPKGSGDNAYIYFPLAERDGVVRGTIPAGENRFVISGAMASGQNQFLFTLTEALSKNGIGKEFPDTTFSRFSTVNTNKNLITIHTETSPPLDSISYWFLKRSINLYGEALAKTLAAKAGKTASTDNGADIIADHWAGKGIGVDRTELNVYDGSGLSPLNRVTTHAQVAVLRHAQKQPWFGGYVNGFPEYNSMRLKSGTISRVKSFCGYHTSKEGKSYIVSFIVNNYNGASGSLVQKMYKVLDVLK